MKRTHVLSIFVAMVRHAPEKTIFLLLAALVMLAEPLSFPQTGSGQKGEEQPTHRCGCPKEKVASHSCCCALMNRACCPVPASDDVPAPGHGKRFGTGPAFCPVPCSTPKSAITDMSGKARFVAVFVAQRVPAPYSLLAQTTEKEPESVFMEVDIPPPKLGLLTPFGTHS